MDFSYKLNYYKNIILQNPTSIFISYPALCNLRCKQCHLWKNQTKTSLTYESKFLIIDKLFHWLGTFDLCLSGGGEPFLNKDLIPFLEYCDNKGIRTFVATNATLIDSRIAKRIGRLKHLTLNFSLDGANAKTHDFLRGVKGTYFKLMRAIDLLQSNGFRKISFCFTLNNYNYSQIEDLYKIAIKKNVLSISITPIVLSRFFNNLKSKNQFSKNDLWIDLKNANSAIDKILELKKNSNKDIISRPTIKECDDYKMYFKNPFSNKLNCNIDQRSYRILGNGEVRICNVLPHSIGNILTEDPKLIFCNSKKTDILKKISKCHLPCKILSCYKKESRGSMIIRKIHTYLN